MATRNSRECIHFGCRSFAANPRNALSDNQLSEVAVGESAPSIRAVRKLPNVPLPVRNGVRLAD
jgi:hypothetical protein